MNARELLRRETGLDLSELAAGRALTQRMTQLGQSDPEQYLRSIGPDELQALIELVVVPESWMFRDAEAFFAVARFVRERLVQAPQRIVRILSLPCAGGEEPYSIAMALHDAGVPSSATAIEAIDLSEVALERARQGRYTRNAFRGADLAFRERHFVRDGADYQINQALRDQVAFSRGNLLTMDAAASAGRYDIVFCRNLLIYFDDATAADAVARLRQMLADDGQLFAGYAEVPAFCRHGFTPLRIPGAFALQKQASSERGQRANLPAPPPLQPLQPSPLVPEPLARSAAASRQSRRPAAPNLAPNLAPSLAPNLAPNLAPVLAPPSAPGATLAGPAALLAQAERLAGQGDYTGAATACHAVLRTHPTEAHAYYILGMLSECESKPAAAADYWRRCVYLQPNHYEALCHLALLAEANGDPAHAARLRQRAARVYDRRDGHATRNLAR